MTQSLVEKRVPKNSLLFNLLISLSTLGLVAYLIKLQERPFSAFKHSDILRLRLFVATTQNECICIHEELSGLKVKRMSFKFRVNVLESWPHHLLVL